MSQVMGLLLSSVTQEPLNLNLHSFVSYKSQHISKRAIKLALRLHHVEQFPIQSAVYVQVRQLAGRKPGPLENRLGVPPLI
jgi:hypothetical protein